MTIRTVLATGGALLALASAPAVSAQTYDAFASFNGTNGAGNFIYGLADPANPGASGTFFSANTNCFISNAICLQQAPNFDVPGFTKGGSPALQYGTVNVPTDRLLAHPGNNTLQTFIAFVAPVAGTYQFTASFNIQDTNPTGVGINLIQTTNGGLPLVFAPLGTINAGSPTFSYGGTFTLGQGYAVGFGLDNAGNYSNDSTGVNLTVAAIPEPSTWALLILGFGAVGAAQRRRRQGVAFA